MSRPEMWSGMESEDLEESVESGQGEEVARAFRTEFPSIKTKTFSELIGLIEDHYE